MTTRSILLSALALLCAPTLAAEEPASFPVERLRPAMDREGLLDVEWGGVGEHLDYDLALWASYAHNPLLLYRRDADGNLQRAGALVAHRLGSSLVASVGLFEWFKLGLELPVVLYQGRGDIDPADAALGQLNAVGLGDLALRPKLRLLRAQDQFVDLALIPTLTLPSGFPRHSYLGEDSLTFAPELALSRAVGPARMAANLGYRWRPDTSFVGLSVGQEIFYRAGVGFLLREVSDQPLEIDATINGATPALAPFSALNRSPVELMAGVSYDVWGPLQVLGGAGVGLAAGYGTPDLRVFAGVRWSPRFFDADGDGIADGTDACRDVPEDADSFEDADGCPDPDNDKDRIADAQDRCPNTAGDAEHQGCPPDDRDGDGVVDDQDRCPDQPGAVDKQGCPDRDGDGVIDPDDQCPDQAGLPEQQGCPRQDRDRDGLLDEEDACPDRAGPAMLKGCPDHDGDGLTDDEDRCPEVPGPRMFNGCPDTDGDGIPDSTDQCPLEPETANGIADEDGCPDKGKPKVTVTATSIVIGEKVYFDTDKATIKARSHSLLRQVALTLKSNPQIELVRIEGHTDDQGPDDYNLALSQQRADAVRAFLIEQGVDGARLEGKGFGETVPVAKNTSEAGREKNRRVEFNIARIRGE